mgnify:CR=1 FL=1
MEEGSELGFGGTGYHFAKDLADSRDQSDTPYKIIGTQSIDIRPLSQILDENLPTERTIDFMSVDVEGLDLDVLRSSNWAKYRPKFLLAENYDNLFNENLEEARTRLNIIS